MPKCIICDADMDTFSDDPCQVCLDVIEDTAFPGLDDIVNDYSEYDTQYWPDDGIEIDVAMYDDITETE